MRVPGENSIQGGMRNEEQTYVRVMGCLSQAFGPNSSFVAFDAFGDRLFFNSKKK